MANSEELRQLRAIQQEAARTGFPINRQQARLVAAQESDGGIDRQNITRLFGEVQSLKVANAELLRRLERAESDLATFTITGQGVAGVGPRGIHIEIPAALPVSQSSVESGDSYITITQSGSVYTVTVNIAAVLAYVEANLPTVELPTCPDTTTVWGPA